MSESDEAMDPRKYIGGDEYFRIAEITPKTELWNGQPTPRMPAGADYGVLVGRVAGWLGVFAYPEDLGDVYASECAFFAPAAPDEEEIMLIPDVAFVRAERLPPYAERPGFLHLAPDIAVGIAEAPIWRSHAGKHLADYLRAGVALIWLVDPIAGAVAVHAPGADVRVLQGDDVLDGGAVLPAFRLPVATLFR
jgi:Uma2 family endonuclease